MLGIEDLHVVGALEILHYIAFAIGGESFNGIELSLLHHGRLLVLDNGYRLEAVDPIRFDGVAIEVPYRLDGPGLAIQLDLVGLDRLLDGGPDVLEACVDARFLDSSVGSCLTCLNDGVIPLIEGDGKGAVDDTTTYLNTEVQLADVIVLQDSFVSVVRSVMGGHPVEGATRREAPSCFQTVRYYQLVGFSLQALADLCHLQPRLHEGLHVLPDLAMDLSGFADLLVVVGHEPLHLTLLRGCRPEGVRSDVLDAFPERKLTVRILHTDRNVECWALPRRGYRSPVSDPAEAGVVLLRDVESLCPTSSGSGLFLLLFLLISCGICCIHLVLLIAFLRSIG
mmetsp:Transcript_38627/g.79129  ORF Transcript_38627/g.79129 Transcript_38627/m.79129 type:complete len:339 (-) Transcript_38627:255-1271(-)